MIKTVIKRDGRKVQFSVNRIVNAICSAMKEVDKLDSKLAMKIGQIVENTVDEEITVEKIQDIIEKQLNLYDKDTYKAYHRYREERTRIRDSRSKLCNQIKGLINGTDENIINENSNKDAKIIPVMRDLLAGTVSRYYGTNYMIPKKVKEAHVNGDGHFHDTDYSPLFPEFNCMLIDIPYMFENGFHIGNTEIETPKSFLTACTVMTQVIAHVASSIYGGNTINEIDKVLEPYVKLSFKKHFKKGMKWIERENIDIENFEKIYGIIEYGNLNIKEKFLEAYNYATELTKKEVYDGCQTIEYQINSLYSSNGQTPFVTLGFGRGLSWEARLIQKNILQVRIDGLGKNKMTAIFPKLIFAIEEGVNKNPNDPNYDIKKLALKCASLRIYPDILNVPMVVKNTGSFKFPMGCVDGREIITYKYKEKLFVESFKRMWDRMSENFEIKEQVNKGNYYMDLENVIIFDTKKGFVKCYRIIKNKDKGDWNRIKFSNGRSLMATSDHPLPIINKGRTFVKDLKIGDKIITNSNQYNENKIEHFTKEPNKHFNCNSVVNSIEFLGYRNEYSYDVTTESDHFEVSGIYSHNCRSFLSPWYNEKGELIHNGRNNCGVYTINLPRLGIRCNHSIEQFYKLLDEQLDIAFEALMYRVHRFDNIKAEVAPILYCEGAMGVKLKPSDNISGLFKNGRASLSLGYIGVHETIMAIYGKHIYDDKELRKKGVEIVRYLHDKCNEWKEKTGYGFSVYSTPAENLAYRFCKIDKKDFGVIKDVTDKDFYTNSFHLDVEKKVNGFDKIDFESPYPILANGGHINYTEQPSLAHNIEALESLWDYSYDKVDYLGTNTPIDKCYICGFEGEFNPTEKGFICPNCGNHDPQKCSVTRRVCGYLGNPESRKPNIGKLKEMQKRTKHI